jgi:hypothetical protein
MEHKKDMIILSLLRKRGGGHARMATSNMYSASQSLAMQAI